MKKQSKTTAKKSKYQNKIKSVMGEWKSGTLHSGKKGPLVKDRRQAIAIAISQASKLKGKKK